MFYKKSFCNSDSNMIKSRNIFIIGGEHYKEDIFFKIKVNTFFKLDFLEDMSSIKRVGGAGTYL